MKRLNNKGIAISGIIYSLLVLFVALLFGILTLLASSKFTFDKLKTDILDKLNGSIISNIDGSSSMPSVFEPGMAVYFDPVKGQRCEEKDAVSTPGTKTGCMKWYVIEESDKNNSKLNLILDHNTTAEEQWDAAATSINGPVSLLDDLKNDTLLWAGVPFRTDKYVVDTEGDGTNRNSYTIDYTGYRARLITANEVAHIVGADREDTLKWDSSKLIGTNIDTQVSYFYFDGRKNGNPTTYSSKDNGWQKKYASSTVKSEYAWLFDYAGYCLNDGCNVEDDSTTGYWTSDALAGDTIYAWQISQSGELTRGDTDAGSEGGVRPVITIDKIIVDPNYNKKEYGDGTTIYFNPDTGQECDDYVDSNSLVGVNTGCMKWYTFNDSAESNTVNMILDHDTTGHVAWTEAEYAEDGPVTLLEQLYDDTSSWSNILTRNDSYSFNDKIMSYTIDFSGYKARIISAEEIAIITGNTGFDASTPASDSFYLDTNTNKQSDFCKNNSLNGCKYGWLYDRVTNHCTNAGCYNNSNENLYGYWTSTAKAHTAVSGGAWYMYDGELTHFGINLPYAVRPVITVPKSLIS